MHYFGKNLKSLDAYESATMGLFNPAFNQFLFLAKSWHRHGKVMASVWRAHP